MLLMLPLAADPGEARDPDGRYANSPLKQWFDSLKSGKGPCCSDADGYALSDVDWESGNGHYRVRHRRRMARRARRRRDHRAESGRPNHGLADPRLSRCAIEHPLLHAGQHDVSAIIRLRHANQALTRLTPRRSREYRRYACGPFSSVRRCAGIVRMTRVRTSSAMRIEVARHAYFLSRSSSSIEMPCGPRMKQMRTPGRMVVGSFVNSTPLALISAATASMSFTVRPKWSRP